MLTKGATQTEIKQETGADVTTRGRFYPDKGLATADHPPLYLHISAADKEMCEKAVVKVQELLTLAQLPNLASGTRDIRREQNSDRIYLDFDHQGYNIRGKIVGPQV